MDDGLQAEEISKIWISGRFSEESPWKGRESISHI